MQQRRYKLGRTVWFNNRIMSGFKFVIACAGLMAAVAANAQGLMVAEYRADQGLLPGVSGAMPAAGGGLEDARDLYAEEIGGAGGRAWSLGQYSLSGIVGWRRHAINWAGQPHGDEHFLALGSKLAIGDSSETHLYHGYAADRSSLLPGLPGVTGSAGATRSGISQHLYFADQSARLGLGYEYARGDRQAVYDGLQGHEISLSGELRIGWGFDARLRAGYGLYSYTAYRGIRGSLTSARSNLSAGISQSFSPDLRWGLQYSYMDEEFSAAKLSQSNGTWGLNLEYRY